ncbi:Carbon-nitrogen hydrolase [Puccinia graminis f. sp. tritici]|uniref:Carbon-nitrogen hydrolase n=1 Tax=Puccinia graminis f. sp. tritici TaxID=56615 RepID=A0A5B0N2P6_PUCGR|nr:Carbon-nitrogen hydrolase [Puccinia graminis f. sp. tritici]KAA1094017.1 Carbon-nitrogen hydrolase [Puccinia graminis f. sp. tritici]
MARTTKIALLQLEPVFKQPEQSIIRANSFISSIKPNDIDLLMLPEMAFTGYNFRSFEDIEPYIESEVDGITITWAKETAKKLNCHVIIGFPQKIQEPDVKQIYNAMGIVSNQGELIKVYHKTQLYPPVDPLWARPGAGFSMVDLNIARVDGQPGKPVNCCVGICMDLSPNRFEAPFEAYELSTFATKNKAELLLCCMAWLDLGPQPNPNRTEMGKSAAETSEQLKHWDMRCTPFWSLENRSAAICNRVGVESEAVYCGTSCVISNSKSFKNLMKDNTSIVIDYASKQKPELLMVELPLP